MTNFRGVIIKRIYFLRKRLDTADEGLKDSILMRIDECETLLAIGDGKA